MREQITTGAEILMFLDTLNNNKDSLKQQIEKIKLYGFAAKIFKY